MMVFVETLLEMNRDFFHFWGYFLVFVALFLESFPFLGALVPGGLIILLLCGFLAKMGFFVLWKVVLVGVVASVVVDMIGYFFGRFVGKDFFRRRARVLLIRRRTIEKVGRIVRKHVGKSLILGKLNPVTRSIAPFVVGNERVGFARFFFYNVIGGVLWVVAFMFVGFIFGNSFQIVQDGEKYVLWVTVVLFGGFYVYYIRGLFMEFFGKGIKKGVSRKVRC